MVLKHWIYQPEESTKNKPSLQNLYLASRLSMNASNASSATPLERRVAKVSEEVKEGLQPLRSSLQSHKSRFSLLKEMRPTRLSVPSTEDVSNAILAQFERKVLHSQIYRTRMIGVLHGIESIMIEVYSEPSLQFPRLNHKSIIAALSTSVYSNSEETVEGRITKSVVSFLQGKYHSEDPMYNQAKLVKRVHDGMKRAIQSLEGMSLESWNGDLQNSMPAALTLKKRHMLTSNDSSAFKISKSKAPGWTQSRWPKSVTHKYLKLLARHGRVLTAQEKQAIVTAVNTLDNGTVVEDGNKDYRSWNAIRIQRNAHIAKARDALNRHLVTNQEVLDHFEATELTEQEEALDEDSN